MPPRLYLANSSACPSSLGHPGLLCLLSCPTLTTIQLLWPVSNWGLSPSSGCSHCPRCPFPFITSDASPSSKPQPICLLSSCLALVTSMFFPFFHWSVSPKLIIFIHLFKKHNFWLCWSFLFCFFSTFCSCFYYFFFLCIYFAFLLAISWDKYLAH